MKVLGLVWVFFSESAQPLQSGVQWEKLSALSYNNVQYPIKIITGEKLVHWENFLQSTYQHLQLNLSNEFLVKHEWKFVLL